MQALAKPLWPCVFACLWLMTPPLASAAETGKVNWNTPPKLTIKALGQVKIGMTVKQVQALFPKVSVLDAGGRAIGVEPQIFIDQGFEYDRLTELIVTKDMTERKTKMIELGDAFIAFPGGTGTLEEIAEVMSKVSLKWLSAPCILYNLNGYYDSLKELHLHMQEKGLSSKERQQGIYFAKNLEEIKGIIQHENKR